MEVSVVVGSQWLARMEVREDVIRRLVALCDDSSFPCLSFVDPDGITIFDGDRVNDLARESRRLAELLGADEGWIAYAPEVGGTEEIRFLEGLRGLIAVLRRAPATPAGDEPILRFSGSVAN